MLGRSAAGAPVRKRDGLVSRLVLQKGDVSEVGFTATWVGVAPGARQRLHDYGAEQVCVELNGRSGMRAGDAGWEVGREDLVCVPSRASHGMENASGGPLVYVPAAAPAMYALVAYGAGRPGPGEDGREEA